MRGLIVVACLALGLTCAAVRAEAPAYVPRGTVQSTIRIWAPQPMAAVAQYWTEGFRRFHPDARIEWTLKGSAAGVPGLYSGKADIALLGRENNLTDDNGFGRVKQYPPMRLQLMGGSLGVPGKSDALVVYVHRDNPLARISLAQLDAAFGVEGRRGVAPIRTWGDLGVDGEWASQPIHLHGYDIQTGTGGWFRREVLQGSFKLHWDGLREYKDARHGDGTSYKAAAQIADAMRDDRLGLAIGSLRYRTEAMKPIAVAADATGPYVDATRQSVIERRYPLARSTYAFIDRPPDTVIRPDVAEFLRYALSREGQADVDRDRGYLPLPATLRDAERARLDD